jgi:hypothetical protein
MLYACKTLGNNGEVRCNNFSVCNITCEDNCDPNCEARKGGPIRAGGELASQDNPPYTGREFAETTGVGRPGGRAAKQRGSAGGIGKDAFR